MIKTQLTREDALQILEVGRALHAESKYKDQPYDAERCWAVLDATVRFPERYFIAYDEEFRGFILMHMAPHFFNGYKEASDLSLFVAPEHRNGLLAPKLIKAAEQWAQEYGAHEMTIYHNTGINTEKAEGFFNKSGYKTAGYIFTKELNNV